MRDDESGESMMEEVLLSLSLCTHKTIGDLRVNFFCIILHSRLYESSAGIYNYKFTKNCSQTLALSTL